jgi:hypothetical protein
VSHVLVLLEITAFGVSLNFHKTDHDQTTVSLYTAPMIESTTGLTHREGDYLMIAILGGGDYDLVC